MKKCFLLVLCTIALTMSCKNKGQAVEATDADTTATAIDSVLAELNDTTPLPMFLYYQNPQYMQMVYWTDAAEPKKDKDNEDYYTSIHDEWALQDMFCRNAAGYTKMLVDDDKWIDLRYLGEILNDPDGNRMYGGELHGRPSIPSPGLQYAFANSKDIPKKNDAFWGLHIVVHNDYLASRKQLKLESPNNVKPMPKAVIQKMEQQYGMKASRSMICTTLGGRYTQGFIQFAGEYKNAPKEPGRDDKCCLAIEVVVDGDSIYSLPRLGYYEEESKSCTWNADDDGEYCPTHVIAAFESPSGLELCYLHGAPESTTVGMFILRNGKFSELEYACYHNMIDENEPLWKKEIAEMQRLYLKEGDGDKNYPLVKYFIFDIDGDDVNEVWMRDKDDHVGALFTFKDRKPRFIAAETEKMKASFMQQANKKGYLKIAGPAGGPSYATEIYVLKNSQVVETFAMMENEGEIVDAGLNNKSLTKWEATDFLDKLPAVWDPYVYWRGGNENE